MPNINTKRGFGGVGIIIIILLALGLGAYFWSQKPTSNLQLPISNVDTTGWETYKNDKYGFSLQYPVDVRISPPAGYVDLTRILSLDFINPSASQSIGLIIVGIETDSQGIDSCMSAPHGPNISDVSLININDVSFLTYAWEAPATAQFGWGKVFEALKNGHCFTIQRIVQGSNPNRLNPTEISLQEADNKVVSDKLDPVLQTFRFTK